MKNIFKNIIMVYRELFRYSKAARWQVVVYTAAKVASPLIENAVPAMAIALLTGGKLADYVLGITGLLFLDIMVKCLMDVMEGSLQLSNIGARLSGFCVRLLKKYVTMDYCNVEPADKQKILNKGMTSIRSNGTGVEALSNESLQMICGLFGVLAYGTIMSTIHWSVLVIIFVTAAVNFLLHRHAVRYTDGLSDVKSQASRINYTLEQQGISLAHGKDIRLYHVENWFRRIFDEQIEILRNCFSRQELRWYFPTLVEQAGTFVRDFVLYTILIKMVLDGQITVAWFAFYVGAVAGFSTWMNNFIFGISRVMTANVETGYYGDAEGISDVFPHGEGEKPDLTSMVSVEFRDVTFRYEEGQKDILSHLSFKIEPGQKIALVGNNGAGKSTIVKLLCGFYMPTEGDVIVNGINTRDYDMDEYGKMISPVFQDGFIPAFTVAMNIAGGNPEEIDRERLRDCLKRAGIWDKIDALEKKEDTYVSQMLEKEGVEFSGGEVQKLLIARALYKNGRLLILDEPTSALDPIAESRIYEQYNEMAGEKTSLFISHRLASTRFCDEILYLEHGVVAERGTHEELLERKGGYAEMFEVQSHYYREEVQS
ncbi:MAG: ABC transporter ATP-binding protein/permease [Roseburia sp.]|nr:ABC transporter ATP-binding protein/permease [Roseburia sp.]